MPLALVYGAGVRARTLLYQWRLLPQVPPPSGTRVVSVGGLEAGGSGKTPACAVIVGMLHTAGCKVGLATRGYGRGARGLRLRVEQTAPRVFDLGDEATMLIAQGLDVPIAAAAKRSEAVRALHGLGCDTVVLDDGFAHRAQGRDVDIVVLRGEAPFGDGRLLPRGTLREPVAALGRASLVWLHYRDAQAPRAPVPRPLSPFLLSNRLIVSHMRVLGAFSAQGHEVGLRGCRVAAFAGTARPAEVRAMIEAAGAEVVLFIGLRDHATLGRRAFRSFCKRARARGAVALVATAKDAVKQTASDDRLPLWTFRVETQIESGHDVLRRALALR